MSSPPIAAPRLSVFIITHNEERHIAECLASVAGLADEIVVLDDGSTDRTVDMARGAGARVEHRSFDDFGHQKQAALELTRGEWALSLDADERVTPSLAKEIQALLSGVPAADGYWIRREVFYLGARLRFGGAASGKVLRLVRRTAARFELRPVHEHLLVDGRTANLRGTLDHVKYRHLAEHVVTINRYTDTLADDRRARGRTFGPWHVLRIPAELFWRLIIRLGVLDGRGGIIYATMSAFYVFLKYAKLWRPEDD